MILSLILLAGFLSYYVYTEYQREAKRVNREAELIYKNTVKEIEGQFLTQIVFSKIDTILDRTVTVINESDNQQEVKINAKKHMHVYQVEDDTKQIKIDSIRITANTTDDVKVIDFFKGKKAGYDIGQDSMSQLMYFLLDKNASLEEIREEAYFAEDFYALVDTFYQDKIKKANLDVDYQIAIIAESENIDTVITMDHSMEEKSIFLKYPSTLTLTNSRRSIFSKILPSILISLFLFSSILSAFFLMLYNIRKEAALLELKNDFVQNITHELKTPISTMSVAMEAIDQPTNSNPKTSEYLSIARDEVSKLSVLVDRVLSIFQLDNQKIEPIYENILLKEFLSNIIASYDLKIQSTKTKIDVQIPKSLNLSADRQWLSIIFQNLIDNALKYNLSYSPGIDINAKQIDNQVIIIFSDNGKGITKEAAGKIFEQFYRIPTGNIHNVKGHGLGLYFVKKLITEMNGSIQLKSFDQGLEFQIIFPKNQ